MTEPKFGDVYEWNPTHPVASDKGVIVMYCGPYDRLMDRAFIIAMPSGADKRLGQVEHVWRVGEHESWRLIDG